MNNPKMKLRRKILFTIVSKIIKYLGVNFPKEVQNLTFEKYKMLLKKFKKISKWKDSRISNQKA